MADNYYSAYVIWNRNSAVLNNYLEYCSDDSVGADMIWFSF